MNRVWSMVALVIAGGTAPAVVAQSLTGPLNRPWTQYPVANIEAPPPGDRVVEMEPQPPAPPANPVPRKKAAPMPIPHPPAQKGHGAAGKGHAKGMHADGTPADAVPCDGWDGAAFGPYNGGPGIGFGGGCATWYGRAGAVFMTRDKGNPVWFSFNTGNQGEVYLSSTDIGGGWGWGADAIIGYMIDPNHAIEAGYWGIYPGTREGRAYDPDGTTGNATDLDSTFAFDSLDYNGGTVADAFANVEMHALRRSYEAHNVEINYIFSPYGVAPRALGCGCSWNFRWLVGVRYLKFDDNFQYIADEDDRVIDGDANEIEYRVDVKNHLIGAQMGAGIDFWLWNGLSLYANAKAGVYGVYVRHHSSIGGAAGYAVVNNALSPYNGETFFVNSTKNDVALMGEIDLGMRWQFSDHWSAIAGYRAVGISGVALSTNQVPLYFADIGGVRNVDTNGSVILHGGYFGFEFLY